MIDSSSLDKVDGERLNTIESELTKSDTLNDYVNYPEEAEKVNARWAMIGFVALIGAYSTTGQIIPGIF